MDTVMLPGPESAVVSAPPAATSLAKPLVLIVEDEASLVTMLRYNLEKQGFRVDEAGEIGRASCRERVSSVV